MKTLWTFEMFRIWANLLFVRKHLSVYYGLNTIEVGCDSILLSNPAEFPCVDFFRASMIDRRMTG